MDLKGLEERANALEKRAQNINKTPLLVVRADLLQRIFSDLSVDPLMKDLFGESVLEHIVLAWDKTTDKVIIADANLIEVDPDKEIRFVKELTEVINNP